MALSSRRLQLVLWACWLSTPGIGFAQAENAQPIDRQLVDQAQKIVAYLKDNEYRHVGVLKFRVQMPGKAPTLLAGALNTYMAERLENALVLSLREEDKISVILGAGNVISKQDKRLSYLKPAEAREMFNLEYPTAWGKSRVRPDVFLTGLVRCDTDAHGRLQVADVSVDALNRQGKWAKILTFAVATDSEILSDLGRTRRARAGAALADFDDVKTETETKKKEEPDPAQSAKDSKVKLTVYYGDKLHVPAYNPDLPGRETLPEPKQGAQAVKFMVQNLTKETVGIVLLVNGLNTLDREIKKSPLMYRKWVLEPAKEYTIAGYHLSRSGDAKHSVEPFRTFSDEEWEALAVDLPEPGLIQLLVFAPGTKEPKEPKVTIDPPETAPPMKISLRGLSKAKAIETRQDLTLDKLKFKLNVASGRLVHRVPLKPGDADYEAPPKSVSAVRGGLGAGKQEYEQVLEYIELPNAVLVEQRFIQFWAPKPLH